jgi:beta-glucosidase-like glycosyl hydrolase
LNDVGVLGCLKHFPGHGNTNIDSHLVAYLKETFEQIIECGFIYSGIARRRFIMMGHLAVPA